MVPPDAQGANANSGKQSVLTFVLSLILVLCVQLPLTPIGTALLDLPVYYGSANYALRGEGSRLYDPEQISAPRLPDVIAPAPDGGEGRVLRYFFPPFVVTLLAPLGLLPVEWANQFWYLFLTVAAVAALCVFSNSLRLSLRLTLVLAAGMAASGPYWDCLRRGQTDPLVLLGLAWFFCAASKQRDKLAGAALTLAVPGLHLVLPLVAYLIGCKKYKIVCSFGLVFGAVVALSLLVPGLQSYYNYDRMLHAFNPMVSTQPQFDPTLRGQLLRVFGTGLSLETEWIFDLSAAIFVIALVYVFFVGKRLALRKDWLESSLLISLPLALVTALHAKYNDLLVLMPVYVVAASHWRAVPGIVQAALVLSGFVLSIPVYIQLHDNYLMHGGEINGYFIMLVILSACLSVYVLQDAPGVPKENKDTA